MKEMAISVAREHLAEAIDDARRSGEPVHLTRRGRRVATVLDSAVYDALVDAADNAVDLAELRSAREDDDFVPWDQVKADLGLA